MNITIRHVEPDDWEALHHIMSQPEVIWGTLQLPHPPTQRQRNWTHNTPDGAYALVACVDSGVVGSLGLHCQQIERRRHVASLGMCVQAEMHGKGVGSALISAALNLADRWLNLKRIELHTWTDNERAVALYKKFGFVIEGTARCYAFRNGEYVDAYQMAWVREREETRVEDRLPA